MITEAMMSVYDGKELLDLRLKCVHLLLGCPHKVRSQSCPFRAVRKESVITRVHWLKNQQAIRLKKFLEIHANCMGDG